jgi:hypothetical protein
MAKIYVASSWRNGNQPNVVKALRLAKHEVYDFKNPKPGDNGFHWSEIDQHWQTWTPETYKLALAHPVAERGFGNDWSAMVWADIGVLVLPSGRSAHIEAGYFVGAGKRLVILLAPGEPELMYKMTPHICTTMEQVLEACNDKVERRAPSTFAPTLGSALVGCTLCGWRGTLDQSDEAGTDCPACPRCGAEANKLGSPAIR